MRLQFYGHASILLESGGTTVVTDPWFSREGAFFSSWFQFPDNTDLDLEPVRNADYVVISHEHEDHFDARFLKTLSPRTKVVIPRYHEDHWYRELRSGIPNEVIRAESRQTIQLGSIAFTPVIQRVPIWDDCALVFETPGGTIVDLNDMKAGPEDVAWIKERFTVDFLFIQYSAASWHPFAYPYPMDVQHRISKAKSANRFNRVRNVFDALGPRWLIPCAGPACFLDESLSHLNHPDFFPTQKDFYRYAEQEGFADRVAIQLPGQEFTPGASLDHPAFTDTERYLRSYRDRRRDVLDHVRRLPEPDGSLLSRCREYFLPLMAASRLFRERIAGSLLLDVAGRERILVDFKGSDVRPAGDGDAYAYMIRTEGRYLARVLEGAVPWESLLLSMRVSAERNPDVYDEFLFTFLRYGSADGIRRYDEWQRELHRGETFILEADGHRREVQRYCPHALGDLSKGTVADGVLTCPLHGWQYRLEDGQGLNNGSSIAVCER